MAIFLPKLRLARVYGFDGIKKLNFEVSKERK